ncbi:hypothetical protein B9Z19DRAFT_970912, partial [Tuber borchii]
HKGVVKLLLERVDVNPDSPNSSGRTPLSYAVQWGQQDLVKLFLRHGGVNLDSSDSSGRTPLSYSLHLDASKWRSETSGVSTEIARGIVESFGPDWTASSIVQGSETPRRPSFVQTVGPIVRQCFSSEG